MGALGRMGHGPSGPWIPGTLGPMGSTGGTFWDGKWMQVGTQIGSKTHITSTDDLLGVLLMNTERTRHWKRIFRSSKRMELPRSAD